MQLATGADAPGVAQAAVGATRLLSLDVCVDRGRDQLVGTASLQKSAQTGMAIACRSEPGMPSTPAAPAVELADAGMHCVKRLLGQRTGSHGCSSAVLRN